MKPTTSIALCLLLLGLGGCATQQQTSKETDWVDHITVTVKKVNPRRAERSQRTERSAVQAGGS